MSEEFPDRLVYFFFRILTHLETSGRILRYPGLVPVPPESAHALTCAPSHTAQLRCALAAALREFGLASIE